MAKGDYKEVAGGTGKGSTTTGPVTGTINPLPVVNTGTGLGSMLTAADGTDNKKWWIVAGIAAVVAIAVVFYLVKKGK